MVAIPWWINVVTGSLWNIFFPYESFLDQVNQFQDNTQPFDCHFHHTWDHRIGNGYIMLLTDALKENTTSTYLNLTNEIYDGHAVEFLSQVIGVQNMTVTSLVLSDNAIGNRGALALAHMISQPNCPIHHLHAANAWMTTRGQMPSYKHCPSTLLSILLISKGTTSRMASYWEKYSRNIQC